MIASMIGRAVGATATGLVGAVAYDGVKKAVRTGTVHDGAVTVLAWGLRGKRSAEVRAEQVRLTTGDLVAEARERVGEQATPPLATEAHDHAH